MKRALGAILLAGALAAGAAVSADPPTASPPLSLAGTAWHTARIEGDALFLLVDEIGLRFERDGRFAARVKFIDGQQATRTGTYRLEGATALVTVEGIPKVKVVHFTSDGADLIVRDPAYDVTARLVPGEIEERWF